MVILSADEHDALTEVFNIGVGSAASAMSKIVNDEVKMSVPSITFETRLQAAMMLSEQSPARICSIHQVYTGAFNTEAVLMFPEDKSLEIVRLMLGDTVSHDELGEMEQEAMNEIGNIILNSCMGMLANIFESQLEGSLPTYHLGTSTEIMTQGGMLDNPDSTVLMLRIDFHIVQHEISGYIALLLDVTALKDLQKYLAIYMAKFAAKPKD